MPFSYFSYDICECFATQLWPSKKIFHLIIELIKKFNIIFLTKFFCIAAIKFTTQFFFFQIFHVTTPPSPIIIHIWIKILFVGGLYLHLYFMVHFYDKTIQLYVVYNKKYREIMFVQLIKQYSWAEIISFANTILKLILVLWAYFVGHPLLLLTILIHQLIYYHWTGGSFPASSKNTKII